jgi:hypothetical protein
MILRWRIRLEESEQDHSAGHSRRFKVTLHSEGESATGYGATAQAAYRMAENKLLVSPGFIEPTDDQSGNRSRA